MKSKKLFNMTLITFLSMTASAGASEDYPFECVAKSVAIYSPGPNWKQLEEKLPEHLSFIVKHLKDGSMDVAGPWLASNGSPTGGMSIYNETDQKKVTQILNEDPFIKEQIAKYEIRAWNQCK